MPSLRKDIQDQMDGKPPRKRSKLWLEQQTRSAYIDGTVVGLREGYAKAQTEAQAASKRLTEAERLDAREALRALVKMSETLAQVADGIGHVAIRLLGN